MKPMILLMALLSGAGIICLCIGPVHEARGQDSQKWIREIDEQQRKIQSLAARFTQKKETALMKEPLLSSGLVRFKRPNRIYLAYEKPQSLEIAIDGQKMRIYQTGKPQIEQYSLGPGKRMTQFLEPLIGVFQKYFAELEDQYIVTYGGMEGDRLYRFLLLPKDEKTRKFLLRVELWTDRGSGAIERFQMTETNGDRLLLEFHNLQINPSLADPDLEIKAPPSVTVVEPRAP